MARSDLTVYISGDTRGLTKATARASTQLASFGRDGEKSMGRLKQAATAAGLAIGSVAAGGLVFGLKKAVEEAREAAKVTAQTEAVIKSTGGTANITSKEVGALADKLSLLAGKDDELIQKGANLLLTFKNIRNESGEGNKIFSQATRVTLDMASAMAAASGGQLNMKSAAIQVGKALNDPINGLSALTRVGVTFTDKEKEKIQRLVESGKTMQAQKMILRELKDEFGGSAKANADAMDRLGVAINNVFEKFGKKLVPILTDAARWLGRFITQMDSGRGDGGKFRRTIEDIAKAVANTVKWLARAGDAVNDWGRGVRLAFKDAWRAAKQAVGDAISSILRGIADMFDAMSFVPGIGKKFQNVADDINKTANRVDKLGEKIRRLPRKREIDIMVKLALDDLDAGNVQPLTPLNQLPSGGPNFSDIIDNLSGKKAKRWAKNNASKLVQQASPLMGAPGSRAPGGLGMLESIGHQMGLVTSSGYRPGDDGWHGQNRARDISGSAGLMMQYARAMFSRFGSRLLELIYSPMGVGIKNGKPVNIQSFYGADVYADHFDHVHVAMAKGGQTKRHVRALVGEEGPEIVDLPAGARVHSFTKSKKIMASMAGMLPAFKGGGLASLNRIFPEHGLGEPGFTMSFNAVRRVFEAAGADPRTAYIFATIAKGESGLRPGIRGDDPGGTKGWGLVQNTPGVWSQSSRTYKLMQRLGGESALRNPFVNAKVALSLLKESSWGAWYGTRYKQDPGPGVESALTRRDRAVLSGRGGMSGVRGRMPGQSRYPYPLGSQGKIIGTPHSGTHTLGNWQSDNAVDIGVPTGTPVFAVTAGTITKIAGSNSDPGSRFNGFQVTLTSKNNAFFYTHLSSVAVKQGQKVKKGQRIGTSGSANNVPHLHFGQQRGDPTKRIGRSTVGWTPGGGGRDADPERLSRAEVRAMTPTRGATTTDDIRLGQMDSRLEQFSGRSEFAPRARERNAIGRTLGEVNRQIVGAKDRLRTVNRELKKPLRPATRQRLLSEKAELLSKIQTLGGRRRELGERLSFQPEVEPGDPLAPYDMQSALARLTPGTEDDLAALRGREYHAAVALAMNQQSGNTEEITRWANELASTREAIESLTGAMAEAARIQQERDALTKEMVENQRKLLLYKDTQGPALVDAVVAAVNGGIGGKYGLGNQTPSFAGVGGLARY